MNPTPQKTKQFVKRMGIYTFMTLMVITMTTILIFIMLGYRFNSQSGTVLQGGLVEFISQPSGANVTVGTAILSDITRSNITLNPGRYAVKMELEGYTTWEKSITVVAGAVQWLNSAHFVPKDPQTTDVFSTKSIDSMLTKTNGKYIALLTDESSPVVTLLDPDEETPESTTVTLPTSKYSAGKRHTFSLSEFSNDSGYILTKHVYDGKVEHLMVDTTNPEDSYRINSYSESEPSKISFDPSARNTMYVLYKSGTLRRIEIDPAQQAETITNAVTSFFITDAGTALYAKKAGNDAVTTAYVSRGQTISKTLDTFQTEASVQLSGDEYFGSFYLTTADGEAVAIKKYDNFLRSDSTETLVPETVKLYNTKSHIRFLVAKADGRFSGAQGDAALYLYDIELDKLDTTEVVDAAPLNQPLQWLDEYHFWDDSTGKMRQYEFDGTNQTDIVTVEPGFESTYSSNLKYLYTVGKGNNTMVLQRTEMLVP